MKGKIGDGMSAQEWEVFCVYSQIIYSSSSGSSHTLCPAPTAYCGTTILEKPPLGGGVKEFSLHGPFSHGNIW